MSDQAEASTYEAYYSNGWNIGDMTGGNNLAALNGGITGFWNPQQNLQEVFYIGANQNVYEAYYSNGWNVGDMTGDNNFAMVLYTISGQVTAGTSGLPGVTVTVLGATGAGTTVGLSATTDSNGNYSFSVPVGGNYTVTPSLAGYAFSPGSQNFDNVNANEVADFTASFTGGSTGASDPYDVGPPSLISSPPGTGSSACTSIAGYWIESSSPQAAWSLTQSGTDVSGTVSSSNGPSCGTVTWTVTGQADTQNPGVFSLVASNPSPTVDACGKPAFTPVNDTVTISGNGCTQGSAVLSSAAGQFNTVWTDPNPPANQIPSSLSFTSNPPFTQPPTTFSNTPNAMACDGTTALAPGKNVWGYIRCITYTVLDQTGKPLSNISNFTVVETLTYVKGVKPATLTANRPPSALYPGATFVDSQWLVYTNGPIPAGTYSVFKQVLTITNTSTGTPYNVRVNCIKDGDTDVTITDVTSSGDQSCTQ